MECQATKKSGYTSYGGYGRKPADPTARQIRQRCREILIDRATKITRERDDAKRRRRLIVATLRSRGALNLTQLTKLLPTGIQQQRVDLSALLVSGRVVKQGSTHNVFYTVAEDDSAGSDFTSDMPSNDVLFVRVCKPR